MSTPAPSELVAPILAALRESLPRERWFGDKARTITSISSVSEVRTPLDSASLLQLVARVDFDTGEPAHYFVPHLLDGFRATDATADPRFHRWLAVTLGGDQAPALLNTVARVGSAEQSNTSVRFGDLAIAKILRRLQPGVHPEVELSSFLGQRARFPHVPPFMGSLHVDLPGVGPTALAVLQGWVDGTGDAWSAQLSALASAAGSGDWSVALTLPQLLGRRTAAMHVALASDPWTADLAPEPVSRTNIDAWTAALESRVRGLASVLAPGTIRDARASELAASVVAAAPALERRAGGFDRLAGTSKTRVHGDYHLGQILVRTDGDVAILDFEGEPLRPLAERRAKTSPLKDVAGMLRSFSYARGTAAASPGADPAALAHWERDARAHFTAAYADTVRSQHPALIPASDEDLRIALTAWELDKAIYEVHYELNNRPAWLWLPLTSLLKLA